MAVPGSFKAYGFVAFMAAGVNLSAAEAEERCRTVAVVAAAEIKASAPEPLSAQALSAARDGAFRGCMASSTTTPVAKEIPARPAQPAAAHADTPGAAENSGPENDTKSGFRSLFHTNTKRSRSAYYRSMLWTW